jgi:uncharacterized protein YjbI with pentapeptide repeats
MKIYPFGITCGVLVCFSSVSFAAMVGSSRPVAQANFQELIKTNACPSCDLAGVVFTRINLSDANLENANLAGAQLFLTDLSNANLRNANLQGAKLGGADLGGADLRGANLTGAVLEGAYLQGAQLDGKIVSDTPYVDENLAEVTEKKYVEQPSQGKKAPYTQEAVVTDPRLAEQHAGATSSPQVDEQKSLAGEKQVQTTVKKMVPMANAVVHDQTAVQPASPAAAVANGEDVVKEEGFWNSVTSFFSKESAPVESTTDQPMADTQQPAKTAVQSKKMVPMADAVVPKETVSQSVSLSEAADPVTERAEQEEAGLWSSITSIFSADKKKEQQPTEKPAAEPQASAVSQTQTTGKEALADNAGVRKMIEQIEGSASEAVETAQVVETPAAVEVTSENKTTTPAEVEEAVVAAEENIEKPVVETAKVMENATDKVATAGAGAAAAASAGAAMVYDVVTPAQAMLKQQKVITRLLDEERCVGCDLAGADLSGQNLENADLERVNLQGANLADIDLEEANLKGALLSGANLRDADLREADLYMADFSGADLTGAQLDGALIDSADFTGAIGVNLEGAVKD